MSKIIRMDQPIISLKGISKSFFHVRALDTISLSFFPGDIHAIVGENGAGKSTLMKILSGDYVRDAGEIMVRGKPERLGTPRRAQQIGIGMIYQELTLLPDRSIAQNVLLGREPQNRFGLIDRRAMTEIARGHLTTLGISLDPSLLVSSLPIALRQMVEIAKALSLKAEVLILDEPTSSLTETESRILLNMMRSLRKQNIALIYISHRLEEVFEIADRITVLRDGKFIRTLPTGEVTPKEVVRMMVGRELSDMYVKDAEPSEAVLLEAAGLSGQGFRNVSLTLNAGEVLGISGLVGAGRTEFAQALCGLEPIAGGGIVIDGTRVRSSGHRTWNVRRAMAMGLVYVPEDRKEQGLFLDISVRANVVVNVLRQLSRWGFINFRRVKDAAGELIRRLNVKPPDGFRKIRNLSGGNQQKVVIAKCLSLDPRILVLDEPTRGIDVGAKAEIYSLIDQLAARGVGIIVISSELPEVLGMSDRILVIRDGALVGEFDREHATQDKIMQCAAGAGEAL